MSSQFLGRVRSFLRSFHQIRGDECSPSPRNGAIHASGVYTRRPTSSSFSHKGFTRSLPQHILFSELIYPEQSRWEERGGVRDPRADSVRATNRKKGSLREASWGVGKRSIGCNLPSACVLRQRASVRPSSHVCRLVRQSATRVGPLREQGLATIKPIVGLGKDR